MIVPDILLVNSLEANTLQVEAALTLRLVLPATLGVAALLAILPPDLRTDLTLGRVLPLHRGVHLLLQLLGHVGRLDGDL